GLRSGDHVVGHAVLARLGDDRRVMGVEEDIALAPVQVALIRRGSHFADAVGVIQQHAEVADASNAGFRAHRRLADLDAREAEDAFLRFATLPVVIDLLVRAPGNAHAPATAFVLVDQHDAVFLALVDRAARAGRHAAGV